MSVTAQKLSLSIRALRKLTELAYRPGPLYSATARAANVIRKGVAKRSKTYLLDDFDGQHSFLVDTDDHIGSHVLWAGMYAPAEITALKRVLKPDSVFFDVGANIGVFSVVAAGIASRGKVVSFEPVGFLNERLNQNIQVNSFSNVVVEQLALGNQKGELEIYLPNQRASDGTHNVSMATLYDDGSGDWGQSQTVPIVTLDEYWKTNSFDRLDVMKMDIEGAELYALQGAQWIFENCRPTVLIEFNAKATKRAGYPVSELEDFFKERGYRLHSLGAKGSLKTYRSQAVQTVLAVPK